MDDMTAAHARSKTRSRADVWFVLIITGTTSAILQVWHATHSGTPAVHAAGRAPSAAGGTALLIALLVGLVPAATAIGLSHVVAGHKSTVTLRVVTFAVMIAAMVASIAAIAAVVRPIDGPYFSWVFGLALDAAALACVWVLLGDSERKTAETSALQVARNAAAEAAENTRRAELELTEATARSGRLEAELTAAKAALDALRSDRKRQRGSARKPTGGSARKQVAGSGPEPRPANAGSSAPEPGPEAALDEGLSIEAEARILELIGEGYSPSEARVLKLIEEGNSASRAGVLAGKSDGFGRQVARLAKAPKKEPAGDDRTDGDMATGEQPRVS